MNDILQWIPLLPTEQEIRNLLACENEAIFVLVFAQSNINAVHKTASNAASRHKILNKTFLMLDTIVTRYWERIHTGAFNVVPLTNRKTYALANLFTILSIILGQEETADLQHCCNIFDNIKLLGVAHEFTGRKKLYDHLDNFFSKNLLPLLELNLPTIAISMKQWELQPCDVPILFKPALSLFEKYFEKQLPALLKDCITNWPALTKWRNLNYLLKQAGYRSVPVEVGHNYMDQLWSQRLVVLSDFLKRQFAQREIAPPLEYLAQHELFEQIPKLRKDIEIPEYCTLGSNSADVEIKAWLGPSGTVSPLHFDAKHNLLCQVFGAKTLLLASPKDSAMLYPHDTVYLGNTSRILDVEHLDVNMFPSATNVQFFRVPLLEGSCVYIPPGWWHYVRAETASFSVSFWFG